MRGCVLTVSLALMILATGMCCAGEQTWFGPPRLARDDFEAGFAECWGRSCRGDGVISVEPAPSGLPGSTHSLRLRSAGSGSARLEAMLGYGTTTLTTGRVSFDLYPESGPGAMELSSEAQWIAQVRWLYDRDHVEIGTTGGWRTLPATISAGRWHHLDVEFHGDRHTWGLLVDGQKLGEWDIPRFGPYNMSVGYAGRAKFVTSGACSFYLDNVRVVREVGTGLAGRVVDSVTRKPVAGATVQVRRGGRTLTDADGRFDFPQVVLERNMIPSNINVVVRAWAPGHGGAVDYLKLEPGTHRTDVTLALPKRAEPEEGQVSGRITDAATGRPVFGASVRVGGRPASVYGSTYLALHVPAGEAQVRVSANGFGLTAESCKVDADFTTDCHIQLRPDNPGASPPPPAVDVSDRELSVRFGNGTKVSLVLGADKEILGFGEVSVSGVALRKPAASGAPKMNRQGPPRQFGPDLEEQFPISYFGCRYVSWEREWDRVVVHSRLHLPDGQSDELDWVLAPRQIDVEGRGYVGLAYGYRFRSRSRKIGQIEDRMTWELGGDAAGNTLICGSTAGANQEYNLTRDGAMDVYWPGYAFIHMNPLDYQINRQNGWELASFPETPALMLIQTRKRPGADVVEYLNLTLVGAASTAETPMRSVLLGKDPGVNQWTNLVDHVQSQARAFYGIAPIEPVTMGRMEEADKWGFDAVFVSGPGLLDNGSYHLDEVPDPHHAVAPWSYEPGGGPENLRSICDQAHKKGLKVVSWIGLLFVECAPVLKQHPRWIGREDWDGDYIPVYADATHLDIRSGFLTYSLEKLKESAALGLDGVWLDSYGMIGCINYGSPSPAPALDVFCQRQAELQRAGMTVLYGEAFGGTFATAGGYPSVWPNGMLTAPDEPKLYLTYLTGPLCDFGIYPMKFDYFKYLAHKAPPTVQQGQLVNDPQRPVIIQANKDYRQVSSYTKKREVLPDGKGVLWHSGDRKNTRVLFAFAGFSFPVGAGEQVWDVTAGLAVPSSGSLAAQPHHTYRITK